MTNNKITHLFCFDDLRDFSEDVRKRFADTSRYSVLSFPTSEELISHLEKEKEHNFCKIAIIGLHDTRENFEKTDHLTIEIKKIDSRTGLILVCSPDKIDEVKKAVKFNIDAYIPRNSNSVLRIHNTVKKLISEHSIGVFRKRRNFSLIILLSLIVLSVLLILIAYFQLPQYF
jgi:hypothetical protein